MRLVEINTEDRRQVRQFLDLPFRVYANIPQWVPPLQIEARRMLDSKCNPYFRHSQAAFWLAYNEQDQAIGRLAVLDNRNYNRFNNEKTAFFYLFECIDDTQTALALFDAGIGWARSRGLERIVGPKGFTALDGIGLLVEGFQHRPAFGLPYNPSYYPTLIEKAGYEPSGELLSGYLGATVRFPEQIYQIAERVKNRRGLHVAHFENRRGLRVIVSQLKDLYNNSLGGTSGNTPLTDDEAKALADQMLWFANPRLIKIVMKGEQPVGFLFAYPDISAGLQRTGGHLFPFGWLSLLLELRRTRWVNINGAGMTEGFRGLGGTAVLFSEMAKSLMEGGFLHADIVQIGIENDRMLRELRDLGIQFYKKHRLYQKNITL